MEVIGVIGGHEGGALRGRDTRELALFLSLCTQRQGHMSTQRNAGCHKQGPWVKTTRWHLDLGLPASGTVTDECGPCKPPQHRISLWPPS